MAKIIPFGHTDFTWKRYLHRICQEDEKAMMNRSMWMIEPLGKEFDKILHDNLDDLLVKT